MKANAGQKIAVIGAGISGLGTAYILQKEHSVSLFEASHYLGGHARTIDVTMPEGVIPVDTGFIVFNYRNYPQLTRLFSHLGVKVQPSNMSFSVSVGQGWLEYGTTNVRSMLAQKRNVLRPGYWRMVRDILYFYREASKLVDTYAEINIQECMHMLGMGEWFQRFFLLPIGGAIWSTPVSRMKYFPAKTLINFFDNHGLLSVHGRSQWHTVQGGSRNYVALLRQRLGCDIHTGTRVTQVERGHEGVTVTTQHGRQRFDKVVFACNASFAHAMLKDADARESMVLGGFQTVTNHIVVHSDTSFMPRRKTAWASWVYQSLDSHDNTQHIALSYWMNRLQNLPTAQPVFVSLNPSRQPDPSKVHDTHVFCHPQYDRCSDQALAQLPDLQNYRLCSYTGAYTRYGFHEDGLLSAVRIGRAYGLEPPW